MSVHSDTYHFSEDLFCYLLFENLLTGWKWQHIAILAAVIPAIVMLAQILIYANAFFYRAGAVKIKKFLKRNSYICPLNVSLFNKKVVSRFPKTVKKQAKQFADGSDSLEGFIDIFNSDYNCRIKNIVTAGWLAHTVSVGTVAALNGCGVGKVAFILLGITLLWALVAIADAVVRKLFILAEKKGRIKFLTSLERNTVLQNKQVDLTVPADIRKTKDSVFDLAKVVEDFLAALPDKGMAKVVLKSLYSANFTSAMNSDNAVRLKNVMEELKNYVG